jgi:hypothetical protein
MHNVPSTTAQQQKLRPLPAGKVTLVQKDGKIYYIFPDAANNQAYVGGPEQYQAYKQLRLTNKLAKENLEAAEMNQDASMNWETWRGWGGAGWVGRRYDCLKLEDDNGDRDGQTSGPETSSHQT